MWNRLLLLTIACCAVCVVAVPFIPHKRSLALPDQTPPVIEPEAYFTMAARLVKAMNKVTGIAYMNNWLEMLTNDVIVCYPFTGVISQELCMFGIQEVINVSGFGSLTAVYTSLQMDSFWIASPYPYGAESAGIWHYTQSSVYMTSNSSSPCSVQWSGTVTFRLNPKNTSQLTHWLESPDAIRLKDSFPCS